MAIRPTFSETTLSRVFQSLQRVIGLPDESELLPLSHPSINDALKLI